MASSWQKKKPSTRLGVNGRKCYAHNVDGNMTKQQGKDATMGNFEQTFENTYDDNGNLVSMKSTYNGDDGYFIDYIYAALNDASYNGEGTLLFDAATDTPSAA